MGFAHTLTPSMVRSSIRYAMALSRNSANSAIVVAHHTPPAVSDRSVIMRRHAPSTQSNATVKLAQEGTNSRVSWIRGGARAADRRAIATERAGMRCLRFGARPAPASAPKRHLLLCFRRVVC